MLNITPNLAVEDIKKSVEFYETLGFQVISAVSNEEDFGESIEESKHYIWAMIKQGEVEIMLQEQESLIEDIANSFFTSLGASCTFYIHVENVEVLYNKVKDKVDIVKDIYTTWYGQREFYIKDIDGYVLGFSQTLKEEA